MGPVWITHTDVVFPNFSGTIERDNYPTAYREVVSPRGANSLYAGGGVWSAWLAGYGLYASTGLHLPDAGLHGVGPDGEVAYVPNYQEGVPCVVREQTGAEWPLSSGVVYDLQLLGGGRAIWTYAQNVYVRGIPQPQVVPGGVWGPRWCEVGAVAYLCYFSGAKGVILHRADDASQGWVIAPPGVNVYNHATCAMGQAVRVAYSLGAGELAHELVIADFDPAITPMVPFETAPPVVDPITSINRPMWLGFFSGYPGAGVGHVQRSAGDVTGAWQWRPERPPRDVLRDGRPPDWDVYPRRLSRGHRSCGAEHALHPDRLLGSSALAAVAQPTRRLVALRAGVLLEGRTARRLQARSAEHPAAAHRRTTDAEARARAASLHVERQQACADLAASVPVFSRLASSIPEVHALIPFSGCGRATGLQDHPDARALWNELYAGVTGMPDEGGTVPTFDYDLTDLNDNSQRRWQELDAVGRTNQVVAQGAPESSSTTCRVRSWCRSSASTTTTTGTTRWSCSRQERRHVLPDAARLRLWGHLRPAPIIGRLVAGRGDFVRRRAPVAGVSFAVCPVRSR